MIVISTYSDEYKQALIDLILSIQQKEFGLPVNLSAQPDLVDIANFYQTGTGNFWLALDGSRVMGTIALLDIGHQQAALRRMFVDSEYRGTKMGVARILLDTLFTWSREREINAIFLGTTAQFLAAHRFYEKNGFKEIEMSELPLQFPVMSVDTKFYQKNF